ncbi:hypothetical protein SmJEL517_g01645 [Synchytrium microbalum]|uniref:Ribosomal protein L13 n=1 Tax=Synchytrium microbalum TaxID=1806994 RepID=A0A507CFJ5_9FUNG|nr:uncharacterized protein SmJEL517_g01645 [Synchytrium microbalum]TPX36283.1 hypothetical protein SmJEL517_g01645 [Synchytrium microbalum]
MSWSPLGKTGLAYAKVWHLVDARDKPLGRLAQRIGIALRGKYKPIYNPAVDTGDYVVVINARHVALSGDKKDTKMYHWHTGWPGGLRKASFKELVEKNPTSPLQKAVYGLLPKNNLRHVWMSRLKIFADDQHPYAANILRDYEQSPPTSQEAPQPQSPLPPQQQ